AAEGRRQSVGPDGGLVLVAVVATGNLAQAGPPFAPPPMVPFAITSTGYVGGVPTLGITLDGKYVAALSPSPSAQSGALLLIPINSSDFGSPVSTLTGVAVPSNDQILLH